jgi:hypothetical protein
LTQNRSSRGILFDPAQQPTHSEERRLSWIESAVSGFSTTQPAQKAYYRIILEKLWPAGHGIPGPLVTELEFRVAINAHRLERGLAEYVDVFRRLRELQGDEGFKSIIKSGRNYQLQSLEIGQKRAKRGRPRRKLWLSLLEKSDHRCAKCGQQEPDVKLSPDHRVPRARNGNNDDENWQPLYVGCNTLKSAACNDCKKNCFVCFWVYPETYDELSIADDNRELIRRLAIERSENQSTLLNEIIRTHFLKNSLK